MKYSNNRFDDNRFKSGMDALTTFAIRAMCLLMVTTALWVGFVPTAHAVGSQEAAEVANERAAAELDSVAGAGTSDQLEGAVDGAVGSVKRQINKAGEVLNTTDVTDRVDAATDELSGKVKRDVGRAKAAASDMGDEIEQSADSVVDSIREFFD